MDSERVLLNKDDHMLIDLPEMIWEKIFSYVKGADMLALTEVCQSWNSYITKHRIMVKFEQWETSKWGPSEGKPEYDTMAMHVIGQSNREFQNIHIYNYSFENLPFLNDVAALKFKWKFIKITRFYMNERLLQFIEDHSKHLIEIQMIGETTKDKVIEHQQIELPILQILQMDNYDYSKKTLKSLYFKGLVKLKELILPLKDLNELLNNDENLINFDLCKINLKVPRATSEINFNKVAKFLLTQRSMVHIHLETFFDITQYGDVWNKLKYLEYISYGKQNTVLNYSKPKDVSF